MSEPRNEQPEQWVAVDDDPHRDDAPPPPTDGWERVGRFGVDAGICWIGDPCYLAGGPGGGGGELLADWQRFCARLQAYGHDERGATAWPMPDGREGRGVVVTTGLGDGAYDVEVRRIQDDLWGRRIAEVRIRFIDDDSGDGIAPTWARAGEA